MYFVPSVFWIKIGIRTDLAFLDLEPEPDPSAMKKAIITLYTTNNFF
jgi:hypothetical protein